jgi:hypothetical protein
LVEVAGAAGFIFSGKQTAECEVGGSGERVFFHQLVQAHDGFRGFALKVHHLGKSEAGFEVAGLQADDLEIRFAGFRKEEFVEAAVGEVQNEGKVVRRVLERELEGAKVGRHAMMVCENR